MTRIDLALPALDLMYLAVGYALLWGVGLVRLRAGDVRYLGLAFLTGWALMGVVLSLLLMAGVPLYVATVPLAAAAVAALCIGARLWRPNRVPAAPAGHPWSLPAAAVAAIAGVVLAVAGAAAVLTAVGSQWNPEFDLLSAWLPRAQIVLFLHHLDPAQWSSFIDPWYPPLVPVMFGATWQYAGGFHPSVLPIQQVVLGLSFVLAALALLDRFVPRWLSFPSFALLIVTPWFWWRLQSLMPDATLAVPSCRRRDRLRHLAVRAEPRLDCARCRSDRGRHAREARGAGVLRAARRGHDRRGFRASTGARPPGARPASRPCRDDPLAHLAVGARGDGLEPGLPGAAAHEPQLRLGPGRCLLPLPGPDPERPMALGVSDDGDPARGRRGDRDRRRAPHPGNRGRDRDLRLG